MLIGMNRYTGRMGSPLGNTLWLVGWVVLLSLAMGAPLAFAVIRTEIPCRRLALSLVAALLFVPLTLQSAAWQAVWGVQGWLTNLLGSTPLDGWPAVIWIQTAAAIPWVVLMVGLGLDRVEPELEEDALLDASPGQVFLRVTLRRSVPAIAAAALWVAAVVSSEMTVTDLYQVRTLSEVAYLQYAAVTDAEQATLGIVWGSLAVALCLAAAMRVLAGRLSYGRSASPRLRLTFAVGRAPSVNSAWGWLALTVLIVLAGVPIEGLVHKAGIVVTRTPDGWQRDWSIVHAAAMVAESPRRCARELQWTLLIGIAAATLAVAVGTMLVWSTQGNRLARLAAIAIAAFALVAPGPLVGMGLIHLFHLGDWPIVRFLYDRTILAPVLAQSVEALPLATIVMWQAISSVPQELLDSSAVDGASRGSVLWRVLLPIARRSLVVAWLVAFAVAAGDLAASLLVLPPGVNTLANHGFGLIHYGVDDQVAGITLAMIAGFVTLGVIAQWLMRGVGMKQRQDLCAVLAAGELPRS